MGVKSNFPEAIQIKVTTLPIKIFHNVKNLINIRMMVTEEIRPKITPQNHQTETDEKDLIFFI